MNTFEYHQLLKYIYFEGYADSYEDAEYLLEELNDDEYEELCEKFVKAMDTRGRGPDHRTRFPQFAGRDDEFDPEFTRKRVKVKQDGENIDPYYRGRNRRRTERRQGTGGRSFSEAKVDDGLTSQQKEIMRNHRLTPGDRLPVRGENPTDTHNRLTNTRRRRTSDGRGARGVRGSKVPEFSIKTIRTPDQIRDRLSQLRTNQTRNNIVPFNREDYEYIISYLIDEGYTDTLESAEIILENMSDAWFDMILEEPFQNEEFKDLTPEKEERVKNRLGDLARTVQVQGAQVKNLTNKPFAKHRPGIKQKIKDIVKSAKKNANLAQNATDALIRTSVGRSANLQSRINDLRNR